MTLNTTNLGASSPLLEGGKSLRIPIERTPYGTFRVPPVAAHVELAAPGVLSDVARAKGMAQVAKDAGLGRESLYKALAPGAKPRFETVMKVARALGVKFTAQPA